MKSYLSLIPISAKVHKRQNRLTLICIILAVFLVTAIFSMVDVWVNAETKSLIKRHGNYHIILNDITESDSEHIRMNKNIATASWYSDINSDGTKDYNINGRNTILYGVEKSYIYDIRNFDTEGEYPGNDNEVMLSLKAKELFGINIGDSITLNTPSGNFDCTVSGFCEDDSELNGLIDGVCTYMNMAKFENIRTANNESAEYQYYIQFNENAKMKKVIADIKQEYNLTDENVVENVAILGVSGVSTNQTMSAFYPLAAMLFILILISGVLMISSCMNSNVAQRTKFFGMLRCIGASKQQIMHLVRLEAVNWCKTAIPIGSILGIATSWIMCLVLKNLVGGEFAEVSFKFSILGIVCGVVIGLVTVVIAAHSPAKRAAKVSPMAAVSGNEKQLKSVSYTANTRLFKVETALGVNHALSSKKNLILITLSFAFTVILFFGFFACLDFARALIPSLHSYTPDVAIVGNENANTIDRSLKEKIEKIDGVNEVFGNSFALETPAVINGVSGSVDLISYDEYMLEWAKKSVVSGDISKVYGNSHYALTVFNNDSNLDVGDKLKIGDDEIEIACVASEGIWGDARATVYCSEETFTRLTGEENYVLLNATLNKNATEETVNEIRNLAGENEFSDYRENDKQTTSSYWVVRIAAYGFLGIITLITIFNIMNSISMSVSARMKQYGAMRAVGMSVKQLTKMVTAEAVTYALCGLSVGSIFGLLLHRRLTTQLILEHFGGVWHIPITPIVIIIAIIILSCILAVYSPAKRIKNMSVTDTLNEH
jgi:putative ABC transport system permease protein